MTTEGKYWDKAWSLVEGCTPVNVACDNCWLRDMSRFTGADFSQVNTREDRLDLPLKTKKPTVWAVWSDLFHESVPAWFISNALSVVERSPKHTFLVLTKRASRMRDAGILALPNLWLGVTSGYQQAADEQIPLLLQVHSAYRFVSVEPMLGPVNLKKYLWHEDCDELDCGLACSMQQIGKGVDWVVLGCESGPKRRPMDIEWARDVVRQCKAAGVPVFVKQLDINGKVSKSLEEWPEDLRVRELPWVKEVPNV